MSAGGTAVPSPLVVVVTSGRLRLLTEETLDAERFIAKPYSPDTLVEKIRRAIIEA